MRIRIYRRWWLMIGYVAEVCTLEDEFVAEFFGWTAQKALRKAEEFIEAKYPEVSKVRR